MADVVPFPVETLEVVDYTEDAQAKVFVDLEEGNLRYVSEIDQWYRYNGCYWEPIDRLVVIEDVRWMNRGTAAQLSHFRITQKPENSPKH
jgi:hypothetical protein